MVDVIGAFNWSVNDLVEEYGDIGHAAAAMAGVPYTRGISKNLAYKAARRNLERYLKGRKPTVDSQKKMNRAGNRGEGKQVVFSGRIRVNSYERDRTITQNYSPEDMDILLDLAAEGDAQALWDEIADMYHVDEMEVLEGDIDGTK